MTGELNVTNVMEIKERNCCNQKEDIKTPNVDSTSLLKEQGSFCLPSSELGANTMADVVPLSLV